MKLLTLTLENFQGVKALKLDFDGRNAVIHGENGTGKTTVFNAFAWLLTGKDSTGTKGYTPKTNDENGGEVHNLEHSAEAVLMLDGGQLVVLKKTFREVYKKKRGSATAEFSGNTVDYYINGVPSKEKEYTSYILEQFGGEEHLKMLTMPDYFLSMLEPKKRRAALSEIFGEVPDEEVIQSTDALADLPSFLLIPGTDDQLYTVAEYRKIADARKREINDRLEKLPERIDEASRSIPDSLDALDEDMINQEIAEIDEHLRRLAKQRAELNKDTSLVQMHSQIASATAEMEKARGAHLAAENERLASQRQKLQAILDEASENRRESAKLLVDADNLSGKRAWMVEARKRLLDEWKQVSSTRWNPDDEICPTCGQALPADKVEQMRGDFNLRRSSKLSKISKRGQEECSQEKIDSLESKASELKIQAEQKSASAAELDKQAEQIRLEIHETPFEETEAYQHFASELETMRAELVRLEQDSSPVVVRAELDEREREFRGTRSALQDQLFAIRTAEKQRERIKELEREEKTLAEEYERTEQGLYLCELFVRRMVELVDERINSHFQTIRFKLFKEQNNGGIADCCEALVPSKTGAMVPYTNANTAAKVTSGLEVAGVLSERFGICAPVFVDSAESVTHKTIASTLEVMERAGIQVILLKVSEDDTQLRMELI